MLRDATTDDIDFIQSILNAPDNLSKLETYSPTQTAKAVTDPDRALFIWMDKDERAGFAWLSGFANNPTNIKLEEFGVAQPGRGHGRPFAEAMINYLANRPGTDTFWLYVAGDNDGAIRFYERLGFERGGIKPAAWHRRQGPVADALFMSLALDTKPSTI